MTVVVELGLSAPNKRPFSKCLCLAGVVFKMIVLNLVLHFSIQESIGAIQVLQDYIFDLMQDT